MVLKVKESAASIHKSYAHIDLDTLSGGPAKKEILVFQNFPLNNLLSENLNMCIFMLKMDQGTVSSSQETAWICL